MTTYECEICHAVNSVNRFHCQSCGTIPARYSWKRQPIRERAGTIESFSPVETIASTIDVFSAQGCERADRMRSVKHMLRTVPADYYAVLDSVE